MEKPSFIQRKGFFLWLRRVADIVYVLFALFFLLGMFLAFYFVGRSFFEARRVNNVVVVTNQEKAAAPDLNWGSWQMVSGFSCLVLPVEALQQHEESYYSKSSTSLRNILFFIPGETQRWLFPNYLQLLLHYEFFLEETDSSPEKLKKTDVIFYRIVREDSNKDGKWTEKDVQTLAFSSPCAERYLEVLTVEKFFGIRRFEDNFLLFYQREGVPQAALVDRQSFALLREERLPVLQ